MTLTIPNSIAPSVAQACRLYAQELLAAIAETNRVLQLRTEEQCIVAEAELARMEVLAAQAAALATVAEVIDATVSGEGHRKR